MKFSFWHKLYAYVLDKWIVKNPRLRKIVTLGIYGDKDTDIHLFGTHLTINSVRENGYLRAFRRANGCSLWRDEIGGLLALFSIVQRGDLFIDVGANIGLFACTVARLPGVEVVAFEAHPKTYERLAINSRRIGVRSVHVAVSDVRGEIDFVDGAVSHVFAAVIHRNDYHFGTPVTVNADRLDNLIDDKKPVVLKIDVEDHECAVITGAAKLLDKGLIKAVLLDASGGAAKAAVMLQERGFRMFDSKTLGPVGKSTTSYILLSQDRAELLGFENAARGLSC